MRLRSRSRAGFTLVEISFGALVIAIVGGMGFAALNAGLTLYAKNIALNYSNSGARASADRILNEVAQAKAIPALINADGSPATSANAAGIRFDKFLGGPYVVTHPGGTGLLVSATSLQLTRSTDPLASPPMPAPGDTILFDGLSAPRAVVSAVTFGSINNSNTRQTINITLQGTLGTAVPWKSADIKLVHLVRQMAFVVGSNGSRNELRYFPSAETITNYSNPSFYTVLSRDIGTQGNEGLPFSSTSIADGNFLKVALRVANTDYGNFLSNKESQNANTVLRVDTLLRPRIAP